MPRVVFLALVGWSVGWRSLCALAAGEIVISEVHYHPGAAQGRELEFVEIHNAGVDDVPIGQWRFAGGVEFVFPADAVAPAGGYVVACHDPVRFAEHFEARDGVFGPFSGALDNSGETVLLVDAFNAHVDAVPYDDEAPWPSEADGGGASIQRLCSQSGAQDPANWVALAPTPLDPGLVAPCPPAARPRPPVAIEEIHYHPERPSGVLPAGDDGEALEFVELRAGAESVDLGGWRVDGASVTLPEGTLLAPGASLVLARDAEALRGAFAVEGAVLEFAGKLSNGGERLTLLDGAGVLVDSVLYGDAADWPYSADGLGASLQRVAAEVPGDDPSNWRARQPSPGSAEAALAPAPRIGDVRRFPEEPRSGESVWVTARVWPRHGGSAKLQVKLLENPGAVNDEPWRERVMVDDGCCRDGDAGDGVFGVELPAYLDGTQVRFRIEATQDGLSAVSPIPQTANEPRADEAWGFYVSDFQSDGTLPVYHILLDDVDGSDVDAVHRALDCENLVRGSFAFRGELFPDVAVRFRGNTMCQARKRNFKIRFNRGRLFRGVGKLNLNSLWTDKSLVRESLAWELLRDMGLPYCRTSYTRLHVSGSYYGLYLEVEHPDARFLARNGLDADGNLYKISEPSPGELRVAVEKRDVDGYRRDWEEETNEGGDYSDLVDFVDSMHASREAGQPAVDFWRRRSLEDLIIDYQASQIALNNVDGFLKNHFLYHDLCADRWALLAWDLDLSFGKFFAGCAVDLRAGRRIGTLNDLMLCSPRVEDSPACALEDLSPPADPWFGTTLSAERPKNWLLELFLDAGDAYYRRAYLKRLWDLLDEKVTPEAYAARVGSLVEHLGSEVAADFDRWGRYPSNVEGFSDDMASNLEVFQEQVRCHRAFLHSFIEERHPEIPALPSVKITEVMYLPESGDGSLEYVELANRSDHEIDMSGWSLGGGVEYTFGAGASVAAGEIFVVAKSPDMFSRRYPGAARVFGPFDGRLANEGELLELRDAGPGHPARLDRVEYDNEGAWPRPRPGESIEYVSFFHPDNGAALAWRAAPGGTPGTLGVVFRRGDANRDDRLNTLDVIQVLSFVFRDGPTLPCLDSVDVDDSGVLDAADAVFLLLHLFRDGPAPPEPYPGPGTDPTGDMLDCRS